MRIVSKIAQADSAAAPQPQARLGHAVNLIDLQLQRHVPGSATEECGSLKRFAGEYSTGGSQFLKLIEASVERFAADVGYVPDGARRIRAPSELPPALERVALHVERSLQAWFAWADEVNTRFLVAEMAYPEGHHEGDAVRMFFYDEDGRFLTWGTWAIDAERRWILCEF